MDGDCVGDNNTVFFCLLNCVRLASADQVNFCVRRAETCLCPVDHEVNIVCTWGRDLFVSNDFRAEICLCPVDHEVSIVCT